MASLTVAMVMSIVLLFSGHQHGSEQGWTALQAFLVCVSLLVVNKVGGIVWRYSGGPDDVRSEMKARGRERVSMLTCGLL